jgi:hypothetical protein
MRTAGVRKVFIKVGEDRFDDGWVFDAGDDLDRCFSNGMSLNGSRWVDHGCHGDSVGGQGVGAALSGPPTGYSRIS